MSSQNYRNYENRLINYNSICNVLKEYSFNLISNNELLELSNYGNIFDYKVLEDYSTTYKYNGNESTVLVVESFSINPVDILTFLNFCNHVIWKDNLRSYDEINFKISVLEGADEFYISEIRFPLGRSIFEDLKSKLALDITNCYD